MPDVFSVPIFLVTFREALETVIIVSVLLAFLKQTLDHDKTLHKRLVRQVNPSPYPTTPSQVP
jgi:high-affinity iron transporter